MVNESEIATKDLEFGPLFAYIRSLRSWFMADINMKWKDNAKGKMFVDQSCIACDACVLSAPKNFAMHEEDGHAFVSKQPETPEEEAACKEAQDGCPVEAIGDFGTEE